MTREEAAENAGISRKLAAFHLDKLVHVGLLDTDLNTPPSKGRRPGRTPKVYEPSDVEIRVSIPERRYELVGDILVDTVADAGADTRDAALRIARGRGAELGAAIRAEDGKRGRRRTPLRAARRVLEGLGYEPAEDGDAVLLRNCPFHRLAERQRELVCGLNRAFLDGLLRGLDDEATRTILVPGSGRCCVELRAPRT